MKIKVTVEREQAQKLIGESICKTLFPSGSAMRVKEVEWRTYGPIDIEITDEPANSSSES